MISAIILCDENAGRHLFILSGQSNMTGALKSGFAKKVEAHFGKESVVIVHQCKPGRGIRFWDKDYVFPEGYTLPGKGRPPSESSKSQHGQLYPRLRKVVQKAGDTKSFETVTFIWMQGESDAGRALGDVYAQSFNRVLDRLKDDLGRDDISFVIGRISDASVGKSWKEVRDAQMQLADDAEFGAWINTDDLNGPENKVHYPDPQYPVLGARFAEKAIQLVAKRKEAPA